MRKYSIELASSYPSPSFQSLIISNQAKSEDEKASYTLESSGTIQSIGWRYKLLPKYLEKDEVLIKILHSSIATDQNYVGSVIWNSSLSSSDDNIKLLGSECTGVVLTIGSNVENVKIGDHVIAFRHYHRGLLSTTCIVPQDNLVLLPPGISLIDAVIFPILAFAWYSVVTIGNTTTDECVVIYNACGILGQCVLQICNILKVKVFAIVENKKQSDLLETG